jgi:lysophospholipase L1-like esterase
VQVLQHSMRPKMFKAAAFIAQLEAEDPFVIEKKAAYQSFPEYSLLHEEQTKVQKAKDCIRKLKGKEKNFEKLKSKHANTIREAKEKGRGLTHTLDQKLDALLKGQQESVDAALQQNCEAMASCDDARNSLKKQQTCLEAAKRRLQKRPATTDEWSGSKTKRQRSSASMQQPSNVSNSQSSSSAVSGHLRVAWAGDSNVKGQPVNGKLREFLEADLATYCPKSVSVAVTDVLAKGGSCLLNHGSSSEQYKDILKERLGKMSLSEQPHIVVLMLGTNDCKKYVEHDTTFNFAAVLCSLRELLHEVLFPLKDLHHVFIVQPYKHYIADVNIAHYNFFTQMLDKAVDLIMKDYAANTGHSKVTYVPVPYDDILAKKVTDPDPTHIPSVVCKDVARHVGQSMRLHIDYEQLIL